jgi:two-component system, cell cycle sensor histidine kinase and response regulator CckA
MSRNIDFSKTVLLVEDLDMLRKMVRDFLESLGMQVLDASSAAEAIHTAHSHQGVIDLLLTDIEMPRMSGWKLANKLARSRPETRILYMSAGISFQEWNDHNEKPIGTYFIQKPFRLEELKTLVLGILSE